MTTPEPITLKKPGTVGGPCRGWCRHAECTLLRVRARSKCLYCLKPIGYGIPIILRDADASVHAECHAEAVAAGTALF